MADFQGVSFGQRRPPLSVTIKGILERYPDGQIFKEMIQNADDAGAKTVQFYIDSRQHGTGSLAHRGLAGFQGPALIAANDASFSEDDWEGIQRLQQSIKAEDPFKVGRFGIGFNSVYHISDVPTIVSGEKVAYLDPQEKIWPGESGKLFTLANLQGTDALAPFNGIAEFASHGMSRYSKTLFRFPLRSTRSDLSENIYNVRKLQQLTDALREEAKYLLLFLRSVNKIEVYNISQSGVHSLSFRVQIASAYQTEVDQKRSSFMARLRLAHHSQSYGISQVISFTAKLEIEVTDKNHRNSQSGSSLWLVANSIGSGNSSVSAAAVKQHVFPWVGTSLELPSPREDRSSSGGRIYCFLPLPIEASSNLPVNVNGTFSLNDERRTLKWPGRERKNDPMAEWNKLLVSELLPPCYAMLLIEAMTCLQPDQFYNAWPDVKRVRGTDWEGLVGPLLSMLFSRECVWTSTSLQWIKLNHASFVPRSSDLVDVVKRVLTICRVKLVKIPQRVWNAMDYQTVSVSVNVVSPLIVRREMRANNSSYSNESLESKLELLKYCLSDENYSDLLGLQLLPLADNSFVAFHVNSRSSRSSTTRYLCSRENPRRLLPNIDYLLVDVTDESMRRELNKVASSGKTQLQFLSVQTVATLLPQCYPPGWANSQTVSLPSPSFPSDWFETFWKWVRPHSLSYFANQLVVPLAVQSTQYGFKLARLLLSSCSPVVYISEGCSPHLLSALTKLQVQCTFYSHVSYLWHTQLFTYLNKLNPSGVLTAIANANKSIRNTSFTSDEASELQRFLASQMPSVLPAAQQQVLNDLPVFTSTNKQGLYSVAQASQASWSNKAVLEPRGMSMSISASTLPSNLVILSQSNHSVLLAHCYSLVALPGSLLNFVLDIIFPMIETGNFPDVQLDSFMQQVLQLFPVLKQQDSTSLFNPKGKFVSNLSSLPFLKTAQSNRIRKAPGSLFDPSRGEVIAMYQGESVFPIEPFNQRQHLPQLRECGLRVSVNEQELVSILKDVSCRPSSVPQEVTEVQMARMKAVLSYISKHSSTLSQRVNIPELGSYSKPFLQALREYSVQRSFLPVLPSCPENYPKCLLWKGDGYTSHLSTHNDTVLLCEEVDTVSSIVGSQMYIVDCPSNFCSIIPSEIPVSSVLNHFQLVIQQKDDIDPEILNVVMHEIYTFMSDNLHRLVSTVHQFDLRSSEWIWIKSQNVFVSPPHVVLKQHDDFEYSLRPYIYQLPEDLHKYSSLFEHFGVCEVVTDSQIVHTLRMIKEDDSDELSAHQAWKMVEHILNWLTDGGDTLASTKVSGNDTIYVPIESDCARPELVDMEEVVYTDLEFLRAFHVSSDQSVSFIHHKVAHLAQSLKVTPLSTHLNISEDAFGDVGQHEPLVTRLKNILRDYKDGLTIIKELLQNADDAEATELNICYDARTHETKPETLIFSGMSECHGPALLIHNNAMFTDEDFENITKLAGATKLNKPLKIGKFGVGFCSVYHITDVPSFVSKDWLYIFDPTLSCLKKEIIDRARPGKKLRFTERLVGHSQQLKPYLNLFGFQQDKPYEGTLFRFPFRTSTSDISGLRYNEDNVDMLLHDVQQAGSKLLLFLKSLKRITVSKISDDMKEPEILLEIRKDSISNISVENEDLCSVQIQQVQISAHSQKQTDTWLVSTHSSQLDLASSSKCATASVACLLSIQGSSETASYLPECVTGEVFCFLPLSLQTGLPVHVSSNFAVLNDRTGIHSSDGQQTAGFNEVQWNLSLMSSVIPEAYVQLLLALQGLCQQERVSIKEYKFHMLWPLRGLLKTHNPWDKLLPILYTLISENDVFYSACTEQWLSLEASKILSNDILNRHVSLQEVSAPQCVIDVVESLQYPLVKIPPTVIRQFPGDQITECMISEEEFLDIFFNNIENLITGTRNDVLFSLLKSYAVTKKTYMADHLRNESCVPCTPDGVQLRSCSAVVDPCNEFSSLFDPEDGMFPLDEFHSSNVIHATLTSLDMICNKLPWNLVIERALTVGKIMETPRKADMALTRASLILKCIERNLHQTTLYLVRSPQLPPETSELKTIAFVPVLSTPKTYPTLLLWGGQGQQLANCEHLLRNEDNAYLAGSQVTIACESNPTKGGCGAIPTTVASALGIKDTPSCMEVMNHLSHIVDTFLETDPNKSETKWIEKACEKIYQYLEQQLSQEKIQDSDLEELRARQSIWTGKEFISPLSIATSWNHEGPYLFSLPHLLKFKPNLEKALCIQTDFDLQQLLDTLTTIFNNFEGRQLGGREMKLIPDIAQEVEKWLEEMDLEESQACYLPDEDYHMRETSNLAFNDAPWCKMDQDCHFVHHKINRRTALKLRVKPVRSKALERYESKIHHFDGVPFGQREELTQRIKNILSEYPCDVTVIKELLQNADDAKATKMYIVLDMRKHGAQKLPSSEWKDLQGPALLVWNDKGFSDDDFQGIQKLGLGSKRKESESIGQYGIGFNVVYHLTDCPSFFTNGSTLCVLDPHCRYIPGADKKKPGRQYNDLDEKFWNNWVDLKTAYLREGVQGCPKEVQTEGTLFRFPLRHTEELVEQSELTNTDDSRFGISNTPLYAWKMEQNLKEWAPKLKEALIFLNHVTELKFLVIKDERLSTQMVLTHHFKVNLDESALASRNEIIKRAAQFNEANNETLVVTYPLSLCEAAPKNEVEQWLIQQGVGDRDNAEQYWKYVPQVKPQHGLAAQVRGNNFQGNVFCFLPLPVESHLPMHVNGKFILDAARSGLWQSRDPHSLDDKQKWNHRLIEALASSYVEFLIKCQDSYISPQPYESQRDMWGAIERYYNVFPNWEQKYPPEREMKLLSKLVYKKLGEHNSKVLLVIKKVESSPGASRRLRSSSSSESSRNTNKRYQAEWLQLKDSDNPSKTAYFWEGKSDPEHKGIALILKRIGLKLTAAPMWIKRHFSDPDVGFNLPQALPDSVFEYYCEHYHQVSHNGTFPCHIKDTAFQTTGDFLIFTKYVVVTQENGSHKEFPESGPFGVPLLLTADEQLCVFDEEKKVISSTYSNIFMHSADKFLHPDMCEVKYLPSYFVLPSEENWKLVNEVIGAELASLRRGRVYKANEQIDISTVLKPLWLCFLNERVFSIHLKDILQQYALLLSKGNQLFSCDTKKEQLLPAIPPRSKHHLEQVPTASVTVAVSNFDPLNWEIYEMMERCGMPILDISVASPSLCKPFCPQFHQPERILANLYFLYQKGELLRGNAFESKLGNLFVYFSRINYFEETSLFRLKSLPLFRNIDNKLCSIEGETFVWPGNVCQAGRAVWMQKTETVFLKRDGLWRHLGEAFVLQIHEISPLVLYVKYIFPHFHLLRADDRYEQLLHIRDTKQLFDRALHDSELDDDSDRQKEGQLFVSALKRLPCLMKDGALSLISEFCDPEVVVFKTFPDNFTFPPLPYSGVQWLQFFCKIGLKQDLTQEEFIQFCEAVSCGRHKDIMVASGVLLNYLFKESDWHKHLHFLNEVSQIAFVCSEPLKKVSWILPVHESENTIKQGSKQIHLTSLRQAALHKCHNLVWTVMPVVSLPRLHNTPTKEVEAFHHRLGLCTAPSCSDVVRNIVNISKSRFENFGLFDKYSDDCQARKGNEDLLKVLLENFTYIEKLEYSTGDIAPLATISCIPVSNCGATSEIVTPVLVSPLQAIASNSAEVRQLLPFLNPLPRELYSVLGILSEIGVKNDIQLSHVKFALETIHKRIQSQLDPNTIQTVKVLLKKLYQLLTSMPRDFTFEDDMLYLPNEEHQLVHCKKLLFDDKGYYNAIGSHFDFSEVSYSVLSLLTDKYQHLQELGFQVKQFFDILPLNVKPIPFSSSCSDKLHPSCKPEDVPSEFAAKLKRCFKITELGHCAQLILERKSPKTEESTASGNFGIALEEFSKSVEVITVSNLKVDVYLELVTPHCKVGTAKVDFSLQNDDSVVLYVDNKADPLSSFDMLESLASAIAAHVARTAGVDVKCLDQPERVVERLLHVSSPDDLRRALDALGINTVQLNLSSALNTDITPTLGAEIPEDWHHRLQSDINNVFRPQEWVGFEERDDYFVYAQVEHQVISEKQEQSDTDSESDSNDIEELPLFRIRIREDDEEGKVVSMIDLHKILRIRQMAKDDGSTELVLYDPESDSVQLWDAVKGDKLKKIMREICAMLKRIWRIKDRDQRRKAIKGMYLKWHPDKNNSPFATKAFQFLQRQVKRLEEGLPLEEPEDEWENAPEPPRNAYWDDLFNVWNARARRYGSSWQREQSHCYGGGHGARGGSWSSGSSCWGWERSIQVSPEPGTAKVWLKQAEYDLTAVQFLLEQGVNTHSLTASAHVCFLAHQVAEKSLKAGMYKKFGLSPTSLKTHFLTGHAGALQGPLTPDLYSLASSLERYYLNTRYPNVYSPPSVPSDKFGPTDARLAVTTAGRIFATMSNIVNQQ